MTNHNPIITSPAVDDSFSELANVTDSTTVHHLSGTMNFKDSDRTDTHTTSAALTNAVVSGGTVIPTASLHDLDTALASTIASDSNGSGVIDWAFNAPDDDFDFLSQGQTLTLTYSVTVADNHGGSATQTITITVTGSDDKPVITMSAGAAITEQPNTTLSLAPDVAHPTVQFTDPDLANTGYTATVTGVSASGVTTGLLPGILGTAELLSFFHIDGVTKAAGSSNGVINSTFAAPDLAFDYLAAGEQLVITYAVLLNDGSGGTTTTNVNITVTGTNDAPVYISGPEAAHLTEAQNLSSGSLTASGDLSFADVDLSDTHSVSTTVAASLSNGGAVPLSNATLLAALSTSLDDSTGHVFGDVGWSFSLPNGDVNFLTAGETLTLTYGISVTDPSLATATQDVTVTVLGVNHPVVITSGPESGSVSEAPDITGSATPDTTTGALAFTDPDVSQTHTVAVSEASALWSGGTHIPATTLAGLVNALTATLNDSTGTGNGSINWTFNIPDKNLDFLAAGETLTTVYDVTVSDGSTTSTQTVTVTAVGANDPVVITSGPESGTVAEQPNTTGSSTPDTSSPGTLSFTDADLNDTHQVAVTFGSAVWSANPSFVPSQTLTDLQTALAATLNDSTGTGSGNVKWNFSIPDKDLDFLAAGETLKATYDVKVSDASTSATQTVTVTAVGANDPVVMTSGPESASVSELPDTTGSSTLDTTPTQTLAFTDPDISDSHTVAVSVASTTWSGGSNIPATTLSDLANALATTLTDSTGTGSGGVNWNFSIPDKDLDFLAAGETLTTVYDVTVSDASTSSTQTVTVTAVGANDDVTITSGPESGTVAEQPNTTGSPTPDTSSPGTLNFTDADLNDTHKVAVALDSAVWSDNSFFVPPQTLADLQTALATTLNDSTGTGSGSVGWTFSIPDEDLDFLGAGETLTATYDVTVSDAAGSSSTQSVVITATGAEDPLVVNPVTAAVSDTAFADAGSVVKSGNVIFDGSDGSADSSTALSVTAVNGQAANIDNFVAGTYGDLFVGPDGTYLYLANSALDQLQVGQNATDQFNFTITDSLGRSQSTTLTFDITGADDAPVITSADTVGSVTEDAGPTVLVNGGFETGDLTGWSASDPAVFAEFLALGGAFGNYVANLAASGLPQSLSQDVSTSPGQEYTLSFVLGGDPDASADGVIVTWDGSTILTLAQVPLGFTQYTFNVIGDGAASTTPLVFNYGDDGDGILLDQVAVSPVTGQATESSQGAINFTDAEPGDTHTAVFQPNGDGYVGAFSLGPISETSSSAGVAGSLDWHFSVDNSEIQFLSESQSLTQDYTVTITDELGASVTQDVTVTINGSNGSPTADPATVITDAGTSGTSFIPGWALIRNDVNETETVNSVDSSSGGTAIANPPNGISFTDDGTLGGQFSYDVTDGISTSTPATVAFDNNPSTSTALTGTGDGDIIIGDNSGETLDGSAGNDILISNAGGQTMMGGGGSDIFAFEQLSSSPRTIIDFNNTTEQDQIAVSASGFGGGLTPGMDVSSVFETSSDNQFASTDSRFHFDTANHMLYFSPDGTSASEVALAQTQNGATLHASDLFIVH